MSSADLHIGDTIHFEWEQHYGFYVAGYGEMLKPTIEEYVGIITEILPYNHEVGLPHYTVNTNNMEYTVGLNQILYKE